MRSRKCYAAWGFPSPRTTTPVLALELFEEIHTPLTLSLRMESCPAWRAARCAGGAASPSRGIPIIIVTAGMDLTRTLEKAALYGVRQVLLANPC